MDLSGPPGLSSRYYRLLEIDALHTIPSCLILFLSGVTSDGVVAVHIKWENMFIMYGIIFNGPGTINSVEAVNERFILFISYSLEWISDMS